MFADITITLLVFIDFTIIETVCIVTGFKALDELLDFI